MNFSIENVTVDSMYIKLDNWDVYKYFKEDRNLQCIDDLIRLFYSTKLWTLGVQGCIHMINPLAYKASEFIIMESDPGMMNRL
jgi:hypothetical protein